MAGENLRVFKPWEKDNRTIGQRSRLFALEPIGIGTAHTESLTSYVLRLAEAHSVEPKDLIIKEIVPLLDIPTVLANGYDHVSTFTQRRGSRINGTGQMARDWVRVLELLTGRTELKYLTMLPWAEIFDWKRLLPDIQRVCFHCFEDSWQAQKPVYLPLLWSLRAVEICSAHRRPFFIWCPYCRESQSYLSTRSKPGHCSSCLSWLGSTPDQTNLAQYEDVIDHDLWIVSAAGELIAAAPDLKTSPKLENVRNAIRVYLKHAVKRYADSPEHRRGLAELRRYPRTERLFELGQILHLSWLLGTTPLKLLTEESLNLDPSRIDSLPIAQISIRRRALHRNFDAAAVRRKLEELLANQYPPLPLTKSAKKAGYHHNHLIVEFPALCKKIAAKHRAYRRDQKRKRIDRLKAKVRKIAFDLHAKGIYPSARRIEPKIAPGSDFRHPELRMAWRQALRDLGIHK